MDSNPRSPSEGQRFSSLLFPNMRAPPPPSKTLAAPSSSCFFQLLSAGRDRWFADSSLEGEGFEPSVPPRRGQHFFETAPEPGDDKPAR